MQIHTMINLVNKLSISEMPSFVEHLIPRFLCAFVFKRWDNTLMKRWFFREKIAAVSKGTLAVHVGMHQKVLGQG